MNLVSNRSKNVNLWFTKITLSNFNQICDENQASHYNNARNLLLQLPIHLDRLIDQPFESAASLQVDRWLGYLAAEGVV